MNIEIPLKSKVSIIPNDTENQVFLKSYVKVYGVEIIIPRQHLQYYLPPESSDSSITESVYNIVKYIHSNLTEDFYKEIERFHLVKMQSVIMSVIKYETPEFINLTKFIISPLEVNIQMSEKNIFDVLNEKDLVFNCKLAVFSPYKELLEKDYTKIRLGNYILKINQEDEIKECYYLPKQSMLEVEFSKSEEKNKYEILYNSMIEVKERNKHFSIFNYSNLDNLLVKKI